MAGVTPAVPWPIQQGMVVTTRHHISSCPTGAPLGGFFGDAGGKGRKGSVSRSLGTRGLNPRRAGARGWLHAERGGHGPEVLVGCADGAHCRSCSQDELLILAVAAPSFANPVLPQKCPFWEPGGDARGGRGGDGTCIAGGWSSGHRRAPRRHLPTSAISTSAPNLSKSN